MIGIVWMTAAGCASHPVPPSDFSSLHSDTEQRASSVQEIVIRNALSLLGTPYRIGGMTPEGFDCTGFINYVYRTSASITLPRESHDLIRVGEAVSVADLRPADIVYFRIERQKPLHVGIYLGAGKFIHAPSTGGKVNIQNLSQDYWKIRYLGGRRIV
ncbi:MAG TPA: C40 family peptidase [Nitrospiria bacterium]|nr:C40 family peptidase [Nitrospiria bacterium]